MLFGQLMEKLGYFSLNQLVTLVEAQVTNDQEDEEAFALPKE